MSERFLGWLIIRREERIFAMVKNHLTKVLDTVTELHRAITQAAQRNLEEANKTIDRLHEHEHEADRLRRAIAEELSKGELPPKDREDLFRFVDRADIVARWATDCARNLRILMNAKIEVADEIWKSYVEISDKLVSCVKALKQGMVEMYKAVDSALERIVEIEELESQVDVLYHEAKEKFLVYAMDAKPPVFQLLRDILHDLEQVADICEDAGDILRLIAIRVSGG